MVREGVQAGQLLEQELHVGDVQAWNGMEIIPVSLSYVGVLFCKLLEIFYTWKSFPLVVLFFVISYHNE